MQLCLAHHAYEPAESDLEVWNYISEGVMGSALDDQQYSPTTLAAVGSLLPDNKRQLLKGKVGKTNLMGQMLKIRTTGQHIGARHQCLPEQHRL